MQYALLVKIDRKFQRRFCLHVGMHKLRDNPRGQSRQKQLGLFIRLPGHASQIVKGNLPRVVEQFRVTLSQAAVSIAIFWSKILRQPWPHGLTGLDAGYGGFKRHGADCRKPAEAAACVKTRQKFVAPVAFKRYAHGGLLPLGVQGAGQSGQQIRLDIGRIFKPEALKLHGQTLTAGGLIPALRQKHTQGFAGHGAGSLPQGTLLRRRKNTASTQTLQLTGTQGKAVRFALGSAGAAVMEQSQAQGFK